MQGWELSCPAESWTVREQTVGPQEVELPGSLQAGLAVETPEWRHQEGEQRGSGGLQVRQVLPATSRADVGGGGGRGFLQV